MISDPELELEFFMAHQLHMDIDELRAMPNLRYLAWRVYFERRAQRREMAQKERGGN